MKNSTINTLLNLILGLSFIPLVLISFAYGDRNDIFISILRIILLFEIFVRYVSVSIFSAIVHGILLMIVLIANTLELIELFKLRHVFMWYFAIQNLLLLRIAFHKIKYFLDRGFTR